MAGVVLKNLNKVYPSGFHAVRDVNLDIKDGEFVVLLGPSGCGKTTTLRMIAGLEEISSGEIFIGERKVNDLPPGDRDIAMVFQNYALYPHMSVYKNMAFGLKMRRTKRTEIDRLVRTTADALSIGQLLERRPRELSGGQRQRVALGRAIVRDPKVFLFDEPLSNLDAKLRVQMRAEMARLHQRLKTTVVYVTHDQVEAMTLGQRIVLMDRGVIQQVDTPLGIYRRPANLFVGSFIGSPAMNMLPGELRQGNFQLAGGGQVELRSSMPDGPATLGVRPEDLVTDGQGIALATIVPDVVEHMGHESIAHFELAGSRHVVRMGAVANVQPGDRLMLSIRPGAEHLFANDEAGERLN